MNYSLVHRTWSLLRLTYTAICIFVGVDKILMSNLIVDWAKYVSPVISTQLPMNVAHFLMIVGIIEVIVGLIVWLKPRFGGYLISAWMDIIIINLITMNAYYDIIARDVVIAVGALSLAWLTKALEE